ncbi:MAG: beta-lactamase family protein [Gemmatimonadota bacterium]|nr:beta-lactamase family protein [Gemmatimonadota bacterium]
MRLLRVLIATAFFCPGLAPAQTSARSPTAATVGFIPDRLARIDTWVQQQVDAKKIPGAVVMIVRDGHVAYYKAFGLRDMTTRAPQQRDDIFRIASQTKAITSTAVMMLWEEGRFALDDPIGKYIPAFKDQAVLTKFNPADSSYESKPTRRHITIRQLLTHTSGIDYAGIGSEEFRAIYAKAGLNAIGSEGEVLGASIDKLGALPLKHEPGERFTYGLSVDVLGRLVEVVSGMPLDQFFRTRIFAPLRMNDTFFGIPPAKRARLSSLHTMKKDGTLVATHEMQGKLHTDFPARDVTYFSGGGGLSSTTADYARFLQMVLNHGELDGTRILGRKTVDMMLTNQLGALRPAFGLGFELEIPETDYRTPLTIGSFSWSGAFNTWYWADPKERLIGLIFTNTTGETTSLGDPFKALVYSALK